MPDPTPLEEARAAYDAAAHTLQHTPGRSIASRERAEAAANATFAALITQATAEAVEPLIKIFEHMRIVALADRRGHGVAEFSLEVINDWLAEARHALSTSEASDA